VDRSKAKEITVIMKQKTDEEFLVEKRKNRRRKYTE
jgi:hypothetical protein